MEELTPKQRQLWVTLKSAFEATGKAPTLQELCDKLNYSATSSVQVHLDGLERKGYISRGSGGFRNIQMNKSSDQVQIPLVGTAACGLPLLAEQNIEAYVAYPAAKLTQVASDYFFLRAKGDSMDKAGIKDGDFVLVRKAVSAEPGERIVALLGDEATIKRLKSENGHYVLYPESTNPENKPIHVFSEFAIQGVVRDVLPMNND
jgi:repressor LexA